MYCLFHGFRQCIQCVINTQNKLQKRFIILESVLMSLSGCFSLPPEATTYNFLVTQIRLPCSYNSYKWNNIKCVYLCQFLSCSETPMSLSCGYHYFFFFLPFEQHSIVCINLNVFIRSLVDIHSVVANLGLIRIRPYDHFYTDLLQRYVSTFLYQIQKSGIPGSWGRCVFTYLRNCLSPFHLYFALPLVIPDLYTWKLQLLDILTNIWCCSLLDCGQFSGCEGWFQIVLPQTSCCKHFHCKHFRHITN